MQVDFYRIGRTPLPRVLATIAERVIDGGGRLLVVADAAAGHALDEALWAVSPESFLPHGRVTADDPGADQPVLIAPDCAAPANAARHVAIVDGIWRDEALAFDRAFHLFGDDMIEDARRAWRALATAEDVVRNFWSQDETGRWTKTG